MKLQKLITHQDEQTFVWPQGIVIPMPSVACNFNPHPPDPRFYTGSEVPRNSLQYFLANAQAFYDIAQQWTQNVIFINYSNDLLISKMVTI